MQAKPIIPWIGGKRRLAKDILPMFPSHTCYVEPFCGAAALLFMKDESKCEVINDINGELVNLYRVLQHLPWDKCVTKYDRPHTLFYMDPPYWQTTGYGVDFGLDQCALMAQLMRSMKGKAIVSVNDHPDMREAFVDLPMKHLKIKYMVGGGAKAKKAAELLICNW